MAVRIEERYDFNDLVLTHLNCLGERYNNFELWIGEKKFLSSIAISLVMLQKYIN